MDFQPRQPVRLLAIAFLLLALAQPARAAGMSDYVAPFQAFALAIENVFASIVGLVEPHHVLTVKVAPEAWHASGPSSSAAVFNAAAAASFTPIETNAAVVPASNPPAEPTATASPQTTPASPSPGTTPQYITREDLAETIAQLQSSINFQLYNSTTTSASGGVWNAIAASQRIDNLAPSANAPLTISSPTISGGTILNASLSDVTGLTTSNIGGFDYATTSDFAHIAAWGDSLTYGTEPSVSFTSQLSVLSGVPVYNGGENGDTSAQIEARMLAASSKYGWPTIIWAGRNDITGSQSTDEPNILSAVSSMVSALQSAGNNNYIILSITNADSEPSGSANYNEIVSINGTLSSTYGSHYLDVREYLVQDGLSAAGLTPSGTDLTDESEDIPPASLRWDGIHFNAIGNLVIAEFLQQNIGLLLTSPTAPPIITTQNLTYLFQNPPTFSFVDSASGYSQNGLPILQAFSTLSSIALGQGALNSSFTGTFNSALGPGDLSTLTTGGSNTAVGYYSLNANTTGNKNVGVGAYDLADNTTGTDNIALGFRALFANTTGGSKVALGDNTLTNNVTGTRDVGIAGFGALTNNLTGSDNVAIGNAADNDNQSPTSTVAVGSFAANGSALYSNQGVVAIGYKSGFSFQTGSDYNTVIGYQAGFKLTTGADNIFIGAYPTAGNANVTTGSQNIGIGYNIAMASSTASNQLDIGNIIFGTGLTGTGGVVAGLIGIGTTTPASKLEINASNSNTTLTTFGDPTITITNSNTTNNVFSSIAFRGVNSSGLEFTGARISGVFTGHTAGSETSDLTFLTDNAGTFGERLRITSTGNVGIGTASPYSRFQVSGPDAASSTSALAVVNSASTTIFSVFDGGNAQLSGTLTQSSDQRLKTNIQSLNSSSSLSLIDSLNPVTFNWIDPNQGNGTQVGFIAQQVQQIFPQLVSTTSATALTPDGTLGLNYIGLISPIVSALQALYSDILSLEQTVAGFATIFHTQELCVGSTCITPAQFQAMVAAAGQQSVEISDPTVTISSAGSSTPPTVAINGDNPATITVGDSYADLGATVNDTGLGQAGDANLGYKTFLNGTLVSNIALDTSEVATDTIDYVATDNDGNTATSTRTVLIEAAPTATSTAQ